MKSNAFHGFVIFAAVVFSVLFLGLTAVLFVELIKMIGRIAT